MRKMTQLILSLILTPLMINCGGSDNGDDNGNGNGEGNGNGDGTTVVSFYLPIADPFVLCHEGVYYAYGTTSDNGFEVFYSDDLESWRKADEWAMRKEDVYGTKWFWAPEVYYVESKKKFYFYYSADEHIAVATADSPLGPFKQEVQQPQLPGKAIDSSLFIDDDGKAYLYFVQFTDGNVIWMAELGDDLMTIKTNTLTECIKAELPWETVDSKVAEGHSVLKHDGVYYLMYSANHYRSPDYGVGIATSDSPKGPWVKHEGNPVLRKPKPSLVGTGHGAPFKDNEGHYRYIFHAHYAVNSINPRTSHFADMEFKNGTVVMSNVLSPKVVKDKE